MVDASDLMLIPQEKLSQELCRDIARLKMSFWPYSFESQLQWLQEQTEPDDRHVLLRHGGELVGYLRLTRRSLVGGPQAFMIGVSTVVVAKDRQGQGLGLALMRSANDVIRAEQGSFGALCCSTNKVRFYERCGWSLARQPFVRADDPATRFLQDEHDMTLGVGGTPGVPVRVAGKPF